jgi:Gpi18-like mannosyltransferase
MSLPKDQAWFRAKRYGYGWGLPARWQGWLVSALYSFSIGFLGLRFERSRAIEFATCVIVLTSLLVAVCAWKGEKPKWRWGGRNKG